MARYTKSVCRQCRREGTKLFLKGERCYTPKCAVDRRTYAPGEHGQSRKKVSEYGLQLREKQKVRRAYGVLEKQFRNYFKEASRLSGITGDNLLQLLEKRLDNVVFRMGFATSRVEARQLINHGHFTVNGKQVDIPSYQVQTGDVIEVKEKSKSSPRFKEIKEIAATQNTVSWLERDVESFSGKVVAAPKREDIDLPIEEHLIVEHYSR